MASSYQPSAGRRTITSSRSSTPSQTHTTTVAVHAPPQQAVLRLRGASTDSDSAIEEGSARRRIQWAEDVIDNEGLGRKKSKVCCIYHAPKGIDESSDESSSDSDDSQSDSGNDGAARPSRSGKGRKDCHDHERDHAGHSHGKRQAKKRSPNAYEKMPKPRNNPGSIAGGGGGGMAEKQ